MAIRNLTARLKDFGYGLRMSIENGLRFYEGQIISFLSPKIRLMSLSEDIKNVSDTAFWIAAYRAQETERADAIFKDILAKKLAGEKGLKMVEDTPHTKAMAFAMVMRTSAIDRLVMLAIEQGVDTVINLGAGLDTRPYRLPLPSALKWIEVDFDAIINYKNNLLANEKPACNLKRISADLSNDAERKNLLMQLGTETKKALVITEGVIAYLNNDQAAQLSKDIYSVSSFIFWIQDYSQGNMRRHKRSKDLVKKLENTAPIKFTEKDPLHFFNAHGWKIKEDLHILDEGDRVGRQMPLMFPWGLLVKIFPYIRNLGNKTYGYVMFTR